jgi:hypothetical protein
MKLTGTAVAESAAPAAASERGRYVAEADREHAARWGI